MQHSHGATRLALCGLFPAAGASTHPPPFPLTVVLLQFAVESQIRFHGFDPKDALIEVSPRPGEVLHRMEDIEAVIAEHGSTTALVLFSGVQYYTGQAYDVSDAWAPFAMEVVHDLVPCNPAM